MAQKKTEVKNREDWLYAVAAEMAPWFEKEGYPLKNYRIGVGFPSSGKKSRRTGECWAAEASADKRHEIFMHPSNADIIEVAGTLAHELTHVAVGVDKKHGQIFKRVAVALGMEGKMRSTTVGKALKANIEEIIKRVGPFPHAHLDSSTLKGVRPQQKNRMLKASCPECKYIVRASKSCFEIGVPPCPNGACKLGYQNTDVPIPMHAEIPLSLEEALSGWAENWFYWFTHRDGCSSKAGITK